MWAVQHEKRGRGGERRMRGGSRWVSYHDAWSAAVKSVDGIEYGAFYVTALVLVRRRGGVG